jgi:tellurium resistance protein TerZ
MQQNPLTANAGGTPAGHERQINRADGDDLEFGLSWDFYEGYMDAVDLDAQAVMFDSLGTVVDAAFYNQLSACGGSVTHSGDNKTGEGEGDDEKITIDVDTLPSNVETIVFVITAYSGGSFVQVESARAELRDLTGGGASTTLMSFSIGCHGDHTAFILAVMHKNLAGQWTMKEVGKPTQGKHFQDCMTDIRTEVDQYISDGVKAERVLSFDKVFTMHKNDTAALPPGNPAIIVGLGWTCPGSIDLDASIVAVDPASKKVG